MPGDFGPDFSLDFGSTTPAPIPSPTPTPSPTPSGSSGQRPATTPFRTSTDLVNAVLANLGVLAAGQLVEVEDFNAIQIDLDSIFRKLAGLEICYVADPGFIPGSWFKDLADIIAGEEATKFGSSPDYYTPLIQRGLGAPPGTGFAAMSLKQMLRGRPTYEVLQAEYF